SERHSTTCLEFRPGAGLWTIVSFADESAHSRWLNRVKTAFRLLADSGFGGERSRGWGRAESPEFIEGRLPEMILGASSGPAVQEPKTSPTTEEPIPPEPAPEPAVEQAPEPQAESQ